MTITRILYLILSLNWHLFKNEITLFFMKSYPFIEKVVILSQMSHMIYLNWKNLKQMYWNWDIHIFCRFIFCKTNDLHKTAIICTQIYIKHFWPNTILSENSHFVNSFFVFAKRVTIIVSSLVFLKSENLQYNTLGRWVDGPNDSSTKRLMFQALFFFIISCRLIALKLFILFFVKL